VAERRTDTTGISLAKGPVGIIGLAMVAFGVLGLLFANANFGMSPPDGPVAGDLLFGIEVNGWTNVLFIAGGALLAFGAPLHWGAKSMALLVGLAVGAASVIRLVDGNDVLGIFAANGPTALVLGALAVALILMAMLPRVRRERRVEDDRTARERHAEREAVREERGARFTREPDERREPVAHGDERRGNVVHDEDLGDSGRGRRP
jgi:hypothetical protein